MILCIPKITVRDRAKPVFCNPFAWPVGTLLFAAFVFFKRQGCGYQVGRRIGG